MGAQYSSAKLLFANSSGLNRTMLDFDKVNEWAPRFAAVLSREVPDSARKKLASSTPRYVEDAMDMLFALTDRDAVIDSTLALIGAETVIGHHGSRLTEDEAASIRALGLVPLSSETRRHRLTRALSKHPKWREVSHRLDLEINAHGVGCAVGRREGQVHLTLSKAALTDDFNHYLTHGSEFDQHVAYAILGDEGVELLAKDGEPMVYRAAIPGAEALAAAHAYFSIADMRARGDVPNLVREFLSAWSFWLTGRKFKYLPDCGMVFYAVLPAEWLIDLKLAA